MQSKVVESIGIRLEPVAILWTDQKPEVSLQFKPGRWGCVMNMLASAAKGKTAAFDRETAGCIGGAVGLGFGNVYEKWPGGIECFYGFLSSGNPDNEKTRALAEKLKSWLSPEGLENLLHGEGYVKSPAIAEKFVKELPVTDIPARFVVFKPLKDIDPQKDQPVVIVFLANPDQLSALVTLYNFEGEGNRMENVILPGGAGCHQIGVIPFNEAKSKQPRAVVGLTDLSARNQIKRQLGHDLLAFTISWKKFLQMESNVDSSFLKRNTWKQLAGEKAD